MFLKQNKQTTRIQTTSKQLQRNKLLQSTLKETKPINANVLKHHTDQIS
jgi:hypothetical protein